MNKMVINHLERLFVTSDASTIVTELEINHPAARLLVHAAKAQEQEVGDGTNLVRGAASARWTRPAQLLPSARARMRPPSTPTAKHRRRWHARNKHPHPHPHARAGPVAGRRAAGGRGGPAARRPAHRRDCGRLLQGLPQGVWGMCGMRVLGMCAGEARPRPDMHESMS